MEKIAMVAMGGALGAVLRYLSVIAIMRSTGANFMGTMFVNVAGSFAMGVLAAVLLEKLEAGPSRFALFFMPGVLGGFTTFSAFSLDAVHLMEKGRFAMAAGYIGGSVTLAILALIAGLAAGRAWLT